MRLPQDPSANGNPKSGGRGGLPACLAAIFSYTSSSHTLSCIALCYHYRHSSRTQESQTGAPSGSSYGATPTAHYTTQPPTYAAPSSRTGAARTTLYTTPPQRASLTRLPSTMTIIVPPPRCNLLAPCIPAHSCAFQSWPWRDGGRRLHRCQPGRSPIGARVRPPRIPPSPSHTRQAPT